MTTIVTLPLPNQIVDGQVADAAPVMADMNYIANEVNANGLAIPLSSPTYTSFGYLTGTAGVQNAFFGYQAGAAVTSTGTDNVAVGYQALLSATTGQFHVAIGFQALKGELGGSSCIGIGSGSLAADTTGIGIIAIGAGAATLCNSGGAAGNTFIGYLVAQNVTSCFGATVIGSSAMLNSNGAVANNSTFIGNLAGTDVTGANNTLIGNSAGATGGGVLTSGTNNTIVGYNSSLSSGAFSNSTVLGAGVTGNLSNAVFLGNNAITLVQFGTTAGQVDIGQANVGLKRVFVEYTNTGTVGNVTIDKASGRINMGSGTSTFTVTNARVTAASHVFITVQQAAPDTTATTFSVNAGAGSFVVKANANATANVALNFLVINAD